LAALLNGLRLGSATATVRFPSVPGAEVRSFGAHLTVAVTTAGPVFSLFRNGPEEEEEEEKEDE
jgi:hypothetical protein